MKLKDNLRYLRKKAGMTQGDLAKKLHIKQYNISDYEIGRIEPSIDNLCKMADVFHVSIDYLVGRRNRDYSEQAAIREGNARKEKEDKYTDSITESIKGLDAPKKQAVTDLVHLSVEKIVKESRKSDSDTSVTEKLPQLNK